MEASFYHEINFVYQFIKETKTSSNFDCIVPVSGGKDGTYVTHQLKNKYNLNPLCITVRPAMELEIGKKNLENRASSINQWNISV